MKTGIETPLNARRSDAHCADCGGIHYGSGLTCPYRTTVCGLCGKSLLEHDSYMFCEGGTTKHDGSPNCPCDKCVQERIAVARAAKPKPDCCRAVLAEAERALREKRGCTNAGCASMRCIVIDEAADLLAGMRR